MTSVATKRGTYALWPADAKFHFGDRVTKTSGSSWTGKVCGFYRSSLTAIGYVIESENEPGSCQLYPERALTKCNM